MKRTTKKTNLCKSSANTNMMKKNKKVNKSRMMTRKILYSSTASESRTTSFFRTIS